MSFWTFALAAVLSTPKQLVTVYLGVILEDEDNGAPPSPLFLSLCSQLLLISRVRVRLRCSRAYVWMADINSMERIW